MQSALLKISDVNAIITESARKCWIDGIHFARELIMSTARGDNDHRELMMQEHERSAIHAARIAIETHWDDGFAAAMRIYFEFTESGCDYKAEAMEDIIARSIIANSSRHVALMRDIIHSHARLRHHEPLFYELVVWCAREYELSLKASTIESISARKKAAAECYALIRESMHDRVEDDIARWIAAANEQARGHH